MQAYSIVYYGEVGRFLSVDSTILFGTSKGLTPVFD